MEIGTLLTTIPASRHSFAHGILPPPSAFNPTSIPTRRPITHLKSARNGRMTISSDWSVSTPPVSPWMPSLEDLDTTNMLLRQRIVFLGTKIDDVTADLVISQLLLLDAEDKEKGIKLFINSPGGSVTAGMGIYDVMKLCTADISTVCFGIAASMGAFLLAAGTKGKRFCMPNARVMIHQPRGPSRGNMTEKSIRIRELRYHKAKVNKVLSRITGKSEQQIAADTERDYFMSAWEAKQYGIVDAVIDDGKPGLVAPSTEPIPPPKSKVWYLWKTDGKVSPDELPSEERLSKNGYAGGRKNDAEKGSDQEKEAGTFV